MSQEECEMAQCSPNQLEMMTSFPALASEQCPIPHHTGQLACLPLATPEIPSDTSLKSIGTPISAQEREESSMHPISSREES